VLPSDLDASRIPRHVAVVMDGNGRWARQRGLKRTQGHEAGEDALFEAVDAALELGVGYVTVYAFSTENWRRPVDEVRFLMNFNESILLRRRQELHERGVRIRFSGRRGGRLPARVQRRMDESEELTRKNKKMTLVIALNYGGRAELADAARAIAEEAAEGRLVPAKVDEKVLARHLYLPDVPDPDLLIRTSGEFRLSNYLLWQLAYAELYFTDVLWPDFKRDHLYEAVKAYQTRDRRFGGLNDLNGE
jgi:undecaprenyl diphosphate synthase